MKIEKGSSTILSSASAVPSWSYLLLLWLGLLLKLTFEDRWWWLGFINSFTPYWFLPLLAVIPLAFVCRKRLLQGGSLLSVAIFLLLYGHLFVPQGGEANRSGSTLTVMTYNIFIGNQDWPAVRRTISESGADVVAVQELNPEMARLMQTELAESYPYQIVDGWDSVLSRYPIALTDQTLPGSWGTPPRVFVLNIEGRPVTLLNAHFYASFPKPDPAFMQSVFQARENQAAEVAEFAAQTGTPLIVTVDLNATDQSRTYRLMTDQLNDAWREAGWGLGHTFPGGPIPNLSRPMVAGSPWPRWLARIDYIFFSDEWRVVETRVGRWDGVSDHRPVITVLSLPEQTPN